MEPQIKCIGCHAVVPDIEGPTFRYPNSSSPGCWKVYGEILEKEYSTYKYPDFHRYTVDAYCVQHPGDKTIKTAQSVNVHLSALYLLFERKIECKKVTELMDIIVNKNKGKFEWLNPPENLGKITAVDVAKAKDFEEHNKMVIDWAQSAFYSWESHHNKIKKIVEEILR